jgi:membrane protease YdiL (CAAX protease family)
VPERLDDDISPCLHAVGEPREPTPVSTPTRTDTTPGEALVVVLVCFGWAIVASLEAVANGFPSSRGFTDGGVLGLVVTEAVFGSIALVLLRGRGYDLASLVPRVTFKDSAIGLGLALAGCLAGALLVLPFVASLPEQPISRMMQASSISPPALLVLACVNGMFEEVFLLGFLQRGLARHGTSIALGSMLLVRLLCHLYQGPLGALYVLGYGGVLGLFFARWPRLWPAVFAHIFWDIVPFLH